MHKNYKLLALFIGLIIISLTLSLTSGIKSRSNFRVDLFSVADTARIQSIKIEGKRLVDIKRSDGGSWRINDNYGINRNLKNVLLAVLNQINVRRPVSKIQQEEIAGQLRAATKITIEHEERTFEFYAGGNAAHTQSYFMSEADDQPYVVEIPGYRNYISGIFELTEMQWRERTLFNTTWRSLQNLIVRYPANSNNDVNICFEEEFFKIDQVASMDTLALMTYLSRYEFFEANEFIPTGFNATYDSLAATTPLAVIELNEINRDKNQKLSVFSKLENDNYILAANKSGELSLIDFARIRQLLARRESFQAINN